MRSEDKQSGADHIGIVVLAAGNSSRLGRPKQLLSYDAQTLLKHSLQAAEDSIASHVVIVLGAYSDTIGKEIETSNRVHVVINSEWEEGIASSLRHGIQALEETDPSAEGAVIMVCDQPFATSELLNGLISKHLKTGKEIVASSYSNTYGPPAFFHKSLFRELQQLSGDMGAKGLIFRHISDLDTIAFPEGDFDIDTDDDYQRILKGDL